MESLILMVLHGTRQLLSTNLKDHRSNINIVKIVDSVALKPLVPDRGIEATVLGLGLHQCDTGELPVLAVLSWRCRSQRNEEPKGLKAAAFLVGACLNRWRAGVGRAKL